MNIPEFFAENESIRANIIPVTKRTSCQTTGISVTVFMQILMKLLDKFI